MNEIDTLSGLVKNSLRFIDVETPIVIGTDSIGIPEWKIIIRRQPERIYALGRETTVSRWAVYHNENLLTTGPSMTFAIETALLYRFQFKDN